MKTANSLIITVIVLLAFTACSTMITPDIKVESDSSIDLSQYSTYAIMPPPADIPGGDPGLMLRVGDSLKKTIHSSMAAKGYKRAEINNADFVINVKGSIVPKTRVTDWGYQPIYTDRHNMWVRNYGVSGYHDVKVSNYETGTLALEAFDNTTKKLAWVGWVSKGRKKISPTPESVAVSTALILDEFPKK